VVAGGCGGEVHPVAAGYKAAARVSACLWQGSSIPRITCELRAKS
jgi:hypothetical protein